MEIESGIPQQAAIAPMTVLALAQIAETGNIKDLRSFLLPYDVQPAQYKRLLGDIKEAGLIEDSETNPNDVPAGALRLSEVGEETVEAADLEQALIDFELETLINRALYDYLALLQAHAEYNEGWLLPTANSTPVDKFLGERMGHTDDRVADNIAKLVRRSLAELSDKPVYNQNAKPTNIRITDFGKKIIGIIQKEHALASEGIKPDVEEKEIFSSPEGTLNPHALNARRLRETYFSMVEEIKRMSRALSETPPLYVGVDMSCSQNLAEVVMSLDDEICRLEELMDTPERKFRALRLVA